MVVEPLPLDCATDVEAVVPGEVPAWAPPLPECMVARSPTSAIMIITTIIPPISNVFEPPDATAVGAAGEVPDISSAINIAGNFLMSKL
jgi:hypothetical protein